MECRCYVPYDNAKCAYALLYRTSFIMTQLRIRLQFGNYSGRNPKYVWIKWWQFSTWVSKSPNVCNDAYIYKFPMQLFRQCVIHTKIIFQKHSVYFIYITYKNNRKMTLGWIVSICTKWISDTEYLIVHDQKMSCIFNSAFTWLHCCQIKTDPMRFGNQSFFRDWRGIPCLQNNSNYAITDPITIHQWRNHRIFNIFT